MINIATRSVSFWLLLVIASACNAQAIIQTQAENFRWGDFGETAIYAGGTNGVQLILTDVEHQTQANQYAAQLSRQGELSAVLTIENYLAGIKQRNANCFDAATPLSVYAQDIQQHHQFHRFTQPFITGFGSAGSYLFAMLTQMPKGIFRGAYSIDWRNEIPLPIAPCNNSTQLFWDAEQQRLTLSSTLLPATPWRLFNTHSLIQQWMPDYPLLKNWQIDKQSFRSSLNQPLDSEDKKGIANLPLIEIPAINNASNNDLLAIVISGDGGWANIDKDIANQLAQGGIAVVGWNSLDYFWEEKSEAVIGKDLQATIDYYTSAWNKNCLLLIGFSMGADVMPFMVNQLNNDTKAKISSVNLLNPSTSVDFVFHVSGWLGTSEQAAHALYPEVKDWNQWPMRCFYSEQETSLCEEIQEHISQKPDKQQLIYLPGDHHFDGDYQKLVQLILAKSEPK
ncbi:MAG: hypothetical protein B0W54_03380 [Cellvibrio sp. 79]|nr:MAG: hypothetical protein B0W54_03380 [Cellvibrio sp. 79]